MATESMLSIVNDCLLNVGADTVNTLNNNRQGRVAVRCLRDAIVNVCSHNHWPWMQQIITADSWLGEVATISPNAVEVTLVRMGTRPIEYVSDHDFYGGHYGLDAYVTGSSSFPRYYTRVSHREYAFNPYPTSLLDQAAIKFHARVMPTLNLGDNFIPDIPADILILVEYYASALLAMKLTGESNISQNFMQLYETNLRQVSARSSMENRPNQSAIY